MLSSPIFSISLLGVLLLVSLEVTLTAADKIKIVPGKAFDRFITIWLENQVRRCTIAPKEISRLTENKCVGLCQDIG